jgi:hypothetical protein
MMVVKLKVLIGQGSKTKIVLQVVNEPAEKAKKWAEVIEARQGTETGKPFPSHFID